MYIVKNPGYNDCSWRVMGYDFHAYKCAEIMKI